jgi:UDP-N-acetylmuramyl pentapeptide synthase
LYTYGKEGQWLTDAMEDADYPVIWMEAREAMVNCITALGSELNNSYILLKGSRECQLETIPEALSTLKI